MLRRLLVLTAIFAGFAAVSSPRVLAAGGSPPPCPDAQSEVLTSTHFKVEYDAPLNRAMRAEEGSGIQRALQFAAEVAGQAQDPSVMDVFNFDVIIPEIVDINGAPFRFINDPATVAAKRKARDQQNATAQATQALPGMAAMLKSAAPQGNQVSGP